MNALQLQNLATLAAAAAAAQTSATSTNANPLSTTSSALGALTSPGKWKALLFLHMMQAFRHTEARGEAGCSQENLHGDSEIGRVCFFQGEKEKSFQ